MYPVFTSCNCVSSESVREKINEITVLSIYHNRWSRDSRHVPSAGDLIREPAVQFKVKL